MSGINATSYYSALVILGVFDGITQISQSRMDLVEAHIFLVSTMFLLSFTFLTMILYYRQIKKVRVKYEEAKEVVGDVVVSFNKQLQRHEEQLERASYRLEGLSAKSENIVVEVEDLGKQTNDLASKVANSVDTQDRLTKNVEDVKTKLNDLKKIQEDVTKHISEAPETKIEAVIPIRREHVLAPLTETELHVLEFIAQGSEKTAPEIRDLTKLTREHSARLVKKLYEAGYLERDTSKTPFRYRVKDEMLKILKKGEEAKA